MAQASVDSVGMLSASRRFEGASTQASTWLASINNEMLTLQTSWTGDASAAFANAMNEWESLVMQIIGKLNEMIGVMGGNAQAYQQTAETNASIAGSWDTGLDGF